MGLKPIPIRDSVPGDKDRFNADWDKLLDDPPSWGWPDDKETRAALAASDPRKRRGRPPKTDAGA